MDSYGKLLYSNTTTGYTWLQIWPLYFKNHFYREADE